MPNLPNTARLLEIMARLRDPATGCPWDREQSFSTIAPYTIEEAYEVAEAIENGDLAALRDELGDLLLQVVFHARMAEEERLFGFEDVAAAIVDKLVRRHPHVFGEASVRDAAQQTAAWEEQKAAERAARAAEAGTTASALDGVGPALPALTRALKIQRRAGRVGFDWPDAEPVFEKIDEELGELRAELPARDPARLEDEVGDLLFAAVNLARKLEVDPETALRRATLKFERRFRRVETLLAAEGRTAGETPLDELERRWQQAKREESESR
jgi:nucleoside triphosphate diphosphatase